MWQSCVYRDIWPETETCGCTNRKNIQYRCILLLSFNKCMAMHGVEHIKLLNLFHVPLKSVAYWLNMFLHNTKQTRNFLPKINLNSTVKILYVSETRLWDLRHSRWRLIRLLSSGVWRRVPRFQKNFLSPSSWKMTWAIRHIKINNLHVVKQYFHFTFNLYAVLYTSRTNFSFSTSKTVCHPGDVQIINRYMQSINK